MRRRSIDWAVPADEGDAAAAAARIARFRAALPPPRDFDAVMAQVRARLQLLCMSPLVRRDAECGAILDGMRACRDMEAFEAAVTRLKARVEAVLRARAAAARPAAPIRAEALHQAERGVRAWRTALKL